ncbi:MAG: S8 family serine peptidase, partial [Saprospiraceae bacterium]
MSDFRDWAESAGLTIYAAYPPARVLVVADRAGHFWDTTLRRPDVLFADVGHPTGTPDLLTPGHNLFVNAIPAAQKNYPGLDGGGVTVSVKEYRFDSSDVDFKNRHIPNPKSAYDLDPHADIMATLIGGAGNSGPAGAGVAPGAYLVSSSFIGLLPDADADYDFLGIAVQNHAYGVGIENYYGAGALAYDVSTTRHPDLLHVFSAGNLGQNAAPSGRYAGLTGWANLSGNFKMAKNALTVGAVDSFYQILPFSARGPAYDGRVKPELVAFGQDGSSGAAALTSGAAAVIRQAFFEKNGYLPSSALLRAILIGGADDLEAPGPDFKSGFGNLNLKKSLDLLFGGQVVEATVAPGDSAVIVASAPPNAVRGRVTLAWNDLPAAPNASNALVNDLDLQVRAPNGSVQLPWVLNVFPHPDSLALPARTGRDTLNTVEKLVIENPGAGAYQIVVVGTRISSASQPFAISICWDTLQHFEWTCPRKGDPADSGKEGVLRWETTIAGVQGLLEWKPAGAAEWQIVSDTVRLEAGRFKWMLPDTFVAAQVRMRILNRIFTSDTFLIAPELRMQIGFNCPDSVLLQWAAPGQSTAYRLWGVGSRYMEPLLTTTDTFAVLGKDVFPQTHFAVSAAHPAGAEGPRSTAPDINQQATGCFINQLRAFLNDADVVELSLDLSTRYRLDAVTLEKKTYTGTWSLLERLLPAGLSLRYTDTAPHAGPNTYRAIALLDDGSQVESAPATVYYAGAAGAQLLPNPVGQGGAVTLIT